jgi:hypothetical protein
MRVRTTAPLLLVIACSGIPPALADCCSSLLDCAATVVTEGLSCEVETLLSTTRTLVTVIQNLGDEVTGRTQSAEQSARNFVTETINTMQSQSQQSATDLATAQTQAATIYRQEMAPTATASLAAGHAQGDVSAPTPTPSSPAAAAPLSEFANHRPANAPHAASSGPTSELALHAATNAPEQLAPHGKYADAFARGVKEITALKGAGDTDLKEVNQYLLKAQQSEGPGVAAANTLAGALTAPITDMTSELTSLLENPLKAYDPSARVNSIEDSIKSHLDVNIQTMIQDITAGPTQQFIAATPAFDDLGGNAAGAKAISTAMERLYKSRTPAAAEALYALLPRQEYAGLTSKAAVTGRLNTSNGQRMSSGAITSRIETFKRHALLPVKLPNFDPVHSAVARYKVQRAEAQSNRTPAMVQTYRSNFSHQMDGALAGKTPADVAAERDQLIAQARTRFAKDPNTENGVIALIRSEAEKHATTKFAGPGSSVPTAPATSVHSQPGLVAASVPAAVAPPMTTGSPAAPHVVAAIKAEVAVKKPPAAKNPAQAPVAQK